VSGKLLVSLLAVLLTALFATGILTQVSFRSRLLDLAKQIEVEEIVSSATRFQSFVTASEDLLEDIRIQLIPFINEYLESIFEPNTVVTRDYALIRINTALLQAARERSDLIYSMTFVDARNGTDTRGQALRGQQLASIIRDPNSNVFGVTPDQQLKRDTRLNTLERLGQLAPSNVYLIETQSLNTGRRVEVLFEYGVPIAYQQQIAGYLLIKVSATQALQEIVQGQIGTAGLSLFVLDDAYVPIAVFQNNKSYLFGEIPSGIDIPLFSFTNQERDADFIPIPSSIGELYGSMRVIPVRTLYGIPSWRVFVVQDFSQFQNAQAFQLSSVLVLFTVLGIAILLVAVIARGFTSPLLHIANTATQIAGGNLESRFDTERKDEIGQLSNSLNALARQTRLLINTLEARVARRVSDIERISEISRDLSTIQTLDDLYERSVDQLREEFGFYHVQIFLLNDPRNAAVVVGSTGEIGQQLLARRHSLEVGSQSIIGQVTEKGRPFITLDTKSSEVPHKFNPLLPGTRSEMALPMRAAGQLMGALDVQSERPDAFDENDVRTFQVLADQLASTISNLRLIEKSRADAEQVASLNRQLTRAGWSEYTRDNANLAFRYDQVRVEPLPEGDLADASPNALSAELNIRGEMIGTLSAMLPPNMELGQEDRQIFRAVVDRVSLALENVRLAENTRRTLEQIERLYNTSQELGAALDVQTVYTVVGGTFSQFEIVDQLSIWRAGPLPIFNPEWLSEGYHLDRGAQTREGFSNKQLPYSRFSLFWKQSDESRSSDVIMTRLISSDDELVAYRVTLQGFERTAVRSVLFVPLATGNRWFGMLELGSNRAGVFSDQFIQFTKSVADQIAVAIENRQLYTEAQQEARRSRALAEAAQVSNQIGLSYNEGVTQLLETGARTGAFDRWWFGTINADGTRIERVTARFSDPYWSEEVDRIEVWSDQGAIAEVARIGTPLVVNNPSESQHFTLPPEQAQSFGRHMALPVRVGTGVYGVLLIGRGLETPELDDADSQLVSALVNQLSTITENRRLFEESETSRTTLQSVLDSLPAGVVVVDAATRRITLSNTQAVKLFNLNYSPRTITLALPDAANPRSPMFPPYRVIDQQMTIANETLELADADGLAVSLLVNAVPIYGSTNQLLAAVAVFTDTSSLREAENALQIALASSQSLYNASEALNRVRTFSDLATVMKNQFLSLRPDRIDIFMISGNEPDRIPWLVRYESSPPDTRSTVVLENSYISDHDYLAAPEIMVGDSEYATPNEQRVMQRLPQSERVKAQYSIPLEGKMETIGRVVVSFFTPRFMLESEQNFVRSVSGQASVIADNILLYERNQTNLAETTVLYQASKRIAEAQTEREVLEAFMESIAPGDAKRGLLFRVLGTNLDDPDAFIEIVSDYAIDPDTTSLEGVRYTSSQFPLWTDLATRQIREIDNIQEAEMSDEVRFGYLSFDISSVVIIPISTAKRQIGVLVVGFDEPREHTAPELSLYNKISDRLSLSLENYLLLLEANARARQLETSAQVGQVATSTLDLAELMDSTVNLIKEQFQYDHVQIFLISEDGKNAELKSSTGEAGQRLLEMRHRLGVGSTSVIGRVTSQGIMYNVVDTTDSRQTHRPNPILPNTRSELAIPLKTRDKIIGALDVQSNQPGAFRKDDETVLSSLADQIAVAIDNANSFEQNKRRLEEVNFLFEAARTASSSELDVALASIARRMVVTTQSDLAGIMLVDDSGLRLLPKYGISETQFFSVPYSIPASLPAIQEMRNTREPKWLNRGAEGTIFSIDDVPGVQSLLAAPLFDGDVFLGIGFALAVRTNAYSAQTAQVLLTLNGTLTAVIRSTRLLNEIREANERLKQVDTLKSQFLANMSHELRTPLNSIIGFSRVILKGIDGPLNEAQTQDLSTIHESGKHLLNLVNDILDQAKIEAGKLELAPDYFDMETLVKSVMSTAVGLVKDRPIRLHQEIQAGMPNAYADEFRTRQVLLNMLSNAAKFTKQGSITVTTFTIQEQGQTFIQVSVSDTGIGIAKENVRKVFAPFEQVDNSTARGAEGTGLGMPIAKSLIEMQGGRIWLESELGLGSTFNITVPIQPLTPAEETDPEPELIPGEIPLPPGLQQQLEQALQVAADPQPLQRSVVAIDDLPEMINMYRRILTKARFEVIGTTNPEDATELIVTYKPTIVLLDVNMPKRNGWEVLAELKDRDETFEYPVIVCSVEQDHIRAYRLGAADYLTKPFEEEDLLNAIRRVELERGLPAVLIVDPNLDTLNKSKSALTQETDLLRCLTADSIEQTLDLIANHRPALVILDGRSDRLALLETVKQIRTIPEFTTQLIVLPSPTISGDELIGLSERNVQIEPGLTEETLLDFVLVTLGLHRRNSQLNSD
jgi:GAF domain-containing protein/DNA-binding response OmpR family regulator/HAMP domain-containing protein/anti-sigma regulatory factor (Ser/Thr protein kinase)